MASKPDPTARVHWVLAGVAPVCNTPRRDGGMLAIRGGAFKAYSGQPDACAKCAAIWRRVNKG